MEIDVDHIKENLIFFTSTYIRLTIILSLAPFIRSGLLPARIKIALALVLSVFLIQNTSIKIQELSIFELLINDIFFALLTSLILNIVFEIFIIGGQIIAMQSGLGFATLIDPATGSSTPLLSQFYLYCATMLFFVLDGHLAFFDLILHGYIHETILVFPFSEQQFKALISFTGLMFSQSIYLAMPAVISLLIANISLALLTRAVPQLNVFSIGFPITLLIGFVMVMLTLSTVLTLLPKNLDTALNLIGEMI